MKWLKQNWSFLTLGLVVAGAVGLKSFDEAHRRQKAMEAEVAASCPQHASKWMLTLEHVTKEETEDVDG